jgi:hypothetical protein
MASAYLCIGVLASEILLLLKDLTNVLNDELQPQVSMCMPDICSAATCVSKLCAMSMACASLKHYHLQSEP